MQSLRALVLILALGLFAPAGAAASPIGPVAGDRVAGCPLPVDAPVVDGFRPPSEPWLPGNRGLTFDTVVGVSVRAVTPGIVTFAGPIAHRWYVTVRRGDGTDVTYSHLDATPLAAGDGVSTGDPVGVAGSEPFHLGHRRDGTYLDPGPLVAAACGPVHAILVPIPP